MTCKHVPGDQNCSSGMQKLRPYAAPATPDAEAYEVTRVRRCGRNLVIEAQYPNCSECAYEGRKVMVFLDVIEENVLRWRRIDPHFRTGPFKSNEAPAPAARFPASQEGWDDACVYATMKASL